MLTRVLKELWRSRARVAEEDRTDLSASPPGEAWMDELLFRMFQLMNSIEQDNFDADRYVGVDPTAFFFEKHAHYFLFLRKHVEQFHSARMLFADEASRALFDQLLLYRLLGHLHVRLPFNTPHNRAQIAIAEGWRVQGTDDTGQLGPLAIYEAPGRGHNIRIKGWKENAACTFLYRQYYFDRGGVAIKPVAGDHVIDAGGCFGDTALGFADAVGDRGHVYVFDPLPIHCAIMRQAVAMNPSLAPHISIFPLGLADRVHDAAPIPDDTPIDPGASIVASEVPTTTIDATVTLNSVPCIDFIKMDVEGSELGALQGAESSLRRWRPKLAISLYHRPEDFFTIPLWIDSLDIGYQFFLDHYSIHDEETVLFAAA